MATLTTLFDFDGTSGSDPRGGLMMDADGNLFGTTEGGVSSAGTVFGIAKTDAGYAGTPTTLVSFNSTDGADPLYGSLIMDAEGNLFGTTLQGGAYGYGTVFEITNTNTGYASTPITLVSFNSADGAYLEGGLRMDASGNLFGTTEQGGAYDHGTVFEIVKTDTGYATTPTTLVSFNSTDGDTLIDTSGLIMDASGNLFGTTGSGGAYGSYGTVFEIAKTDTGYATTPNTLVSFNSTNGADLESGLIVDAEGNLFGTARQGGLYNGGTVFEIAKTDTGYANTPTVLVNFDFGSRALGGLIIDAAGNLFGTTQDGGTQGFGTVYEIAKTATGYANTPTILVNFNSADGAFPASALIADANGDLFGTTALGGTYNQGTVFTITDSGFVVAVSKYWSGTNWVLADGSATTAPGPSDTVILGGTGKPTSGTVTISDEVGTVEVHGAGPWTIDGTGPIDNLVVDTGAIVTVFPTVGHLTVHDAFGPNATVIPAGITFRNAMPIGTTFDFDGTVSINTTRQGSFTVLQVTETTSHLIIANIGLPGGFQFSQNGNEVSISGNDPGPTAGDVTASVNLYQTADLTAAILAKVTPGLVGDVETLTAVGPNIGGLITLSNGHLTYAAPSIGILSHIPANGSLTDTFTYTVTDQYGTSATGHVQVTVNNPAIVIEGPLKGNATIRGGSVTNIVNAHGSGNTIIESGGNDIVNAGDGRATVRTGDGDVVVNLNGKNNSVLTGAGRDTINILSGGSDNIKQGTGSLNVFETAGSAGGNTYVLGGSGSAALLVLYGKNDTVFVHGGITIINGVSDGLEVDVGKEGGNIDVLNFLHDSNVLIDLLGGVGGYKTAKAVIAALQSDGQGGTLLSLGSAGSIDFLGVPLGTLKAASFQIG